MFPAPHGVNIAIVGGLIAGLIAFFLCCTCVCATCFYCGKNTAQGTGLSTEEVQKWHTQMRIIEPYCSTREPELDTIWVLQDNGSGDGARSPNSSSGGGRLSPNPSPGRRSSHEDGGGMGMGGGMGHGDHDGGMGGGGGRHGGGQNNKNKKPGQKKSGSKGSKK